MPRSETIVVAFVASPGDLEPERNKLEEVIRELNVTWSKNLGVRLELVRWETSAYPGIGEDAQDVVNQQIGDSYDIFIGLMWSRFGTQTGRAGSGTEEEFRRAKHMYETDPSSIRIMFYFKDAPVSPSKLNPQDLAKIQAFKSSLGEEGVLYWTFESVDDFANLARMHLARQIQQFRDASPVSVTTSDAVEPPRDVQAGPEESEGEMGLLDLMEVFEERFATVNEISERITKAITDLGDKMRSRTAELNEAKLGTNTTLSRSDQKALINRAADDMDQFVTRGGAELPIFRQALQEGIEALGKAAVLAVDLDRNDLSKVREGRDAVVRLEGSIAGAEGPTVEFRDTIDGLPRMTTRINRAKKDVVRVLDDLLDGLRDGRRDASEAAKLIDAMLPKAEDV